MDSTSSFSTRKLRRKKTVEDLKNLIKAAKGEIKSTILIKNINLIDVILGDIREKVNIAIWGDYIVRVGYFRPERYVGPDTLVIDGRDAEVATPGFIDPHVHVESSLLTIQEFSKVVALHGTTTVAADPHEIGNVLGVEGIKLFIEESKYVPIRVFLYVPSCVPPTAAGLDTPGKVIKSDDVLELLQYDEIIGLGEVMDFLGVINEDEELLKKIAYALESGKVIDGHAPQLSEDQLVPYLITGVKGDHESVFLDEALLKLRNGMYILMREGSAWRDLEELSKLFTYMRIDPRHVALATDDMEIMDLVREGHMDRALRRAVSLGIDPIRAVQMATLNNAEYLGLTELGALTPGKLADVVILKNFRRFQVRDVIAGGKLVVRNGEYVFRHERKFEFPEFVRKTINVSKVPKPEDFYIRVKSVKEGRARVYAIKAVLGKAITLKDEIVVQVSDHKLILSGDSQALYIATVERHHATGNIGRAFVTGLNLKRGAIAQTIAHDVHNIVVVGKKVEDMAKAVEELVKMGGGMVAVANGSVIGKLPLPIAGLMSDEPYPEVLRKLEKYVASLNLLGVNYEAMFMTLALLPLPVIPELRVTDKGLVDVASGRIIDPVIEVEPVE